MTNSEKFGCGCVILISQVFWGDKKLGYGEIQEFVMANSLLIKYMVSVLLSFSTKYMISTLFGWTIYIRLPDDICKNGNYV